MFSNNYSVLIENSEVVSVACDPYHPALVIKFSSGRDHPFLDNSHKYFNFRRACYPDICSFLLSFNWLETIVSLNVDQATNALYDALHFCVKNFVPEVSYSPSKFPLWFSKDLKFIVFSKKRAHNKYKVSRCPRDFNEFSNLRARYKYEYKRCYKLFIAQTECKLKTNPRSFWDFVQKNKSGDGILYTVYFDKKIGSSLFSSNFSTVYATPSSSQTPVISFSHFNLPSNCSFTTNDVELSLSVLKTSKSTGPDGLPGTFQYNIRSALCFPLW